jgi:hypothetical protein
VIMRPLFAEWMHSYNRPPSVSPWVGLACSHPETLCNWARPLTTMVMLLLLLLLLLAPKVCDAKPDLHYICITLELVFD